MIITQEQWEELTDGQKHAVLTFINRLLKRRPNKMSFYGFDNSTYDEHSTKLNIPYTNTKHKQ